ncbi:alpha-amylase [Pelagivirga sediminicola]|uniref:Alpha-amylase n=1 Tax=Pelagivirga sediminicola TaxID=2170575 RepID=A0A2T7G9P5_9RHOB|nr:transporter [Pelagivirga sediminicola]PVA11142.1 alpha-amylase [Pelagivirga sediminicola]
MKRFLLQALALAAGLTGAPAMAQDMSMPATGAPKGQMAQGAHGAIGGHGDMHGPAGVMGNHLARQGKFMMSYRFGAMSMSDNRIGTREVSSDTIATTIPNVFFGAPGQPPILRVVPQEMTMQMHMLGLMYGATDRLSLMAMLPYVEKSMTSLTYAGPSGTATLGTSKMRAGGLGDIRIGATYGLKPTGASRVLLSMSLSLPTGSITESGTMLSPMGTPMTMRMAYPMQLGSGTYDLMPALAYRSGAGRVNWGGQLRGIIRLGSNDEGYSLGDEIALSAWASYKPGAAVSWWGRIEAARLGRIDGRDPQIRGAMQGANPAFHGGDTVTLTAGVDYTMQTGPLKGHKLGADIGVPIYQDLNGPRLGTDWVLGVGWRRMF